VRVAVHLELGEQGGQAFGAGGVGAGVGVHQLLQVLAHAVGHPLEPLRVRDEVVEGPDQAMEGLVRQGCPAGQQVLDIADDRLGRIGRRCRVCAQQGPERVTELGAQHIP